MMTALGVLAEPAILLVYGAKWQASIDILQLLCIAGLAQSAYNTSAWIFLSQGRADRLLWLGVYATVLRTVGVLVGSHWGLHGVAVAYVLGSALLGGPTWWLAGRLLQIGLGELLRTVAGPWLCSMGMGLMLWAVERWPLATQGAAVRLSTGLLLSACCYGWLARQMQLPAWRELGEILAGFGRTQGRIARWLFGTQRPA